MALNEKKMVGRLLLTQITMWVIAVALVLGVLSLANKRANTRIQSVNSVLTTDINEIQDSHTLLKREVKKNTELISNNAAAINANANLIGINIAAINANTKLIANNIADIQKLSDAHKKLANIVYAHGRKINRAIWELVFKIAYGDTKKARATWNQYCKCTNLPLWKDAVSKLNDKEAEKILKINEIQNETQNTKYQISRLKSKCFK